MTPNYGYNLIRWIGKRVLLEDSLAVPGRFLQFTEEPWITIWEPCISCIKVNCCFIVFTAMFLKSLKSRNAKCGKNGFTTLLNQNAFLKMMISGVDINYYTDLRLTTALDFTCWNVLIYTPVNALNNIKSLTSNWLILNKGSFELQMFQAYFLNSCIVYGSHKGFLLHFFGVLSQ